MRHVRHRRWIPLLLIPLSVLGVELLDREEVPEVEASERIVLRIDDADVPIYVDIGQPRDRFLKTVGIGGDSNVVVFGDEEPRCIEPAYLEIPVTVVYFTRSGLVRGVFELEPDDPEPACLEDGVTPRFALVAPRQRVSVRVGERIGIPEATLEHLSVAEFLVSF